MKRSTPVVLLSILLAIPLFATFSFGKEIRYLSFVAKNRHNIFVRDLDQDEIEFKLDGELVEIGFFGFRDITTAYAFLLENSPRTAHFAISMPQAGRVNPIDRIRYEMTYDFFGPLTGSGSVLLGEFFKEVKILQPFTDQGELILYAMNSMQLNFTGVMFDDPEVGRVIGRGVDLLRDRSEKRKVMVLFTTTIDRESYGNLEEYQLMLRNVDLELYVISYAPRFVSGIGHSFTEKMNRYFFRNLVQETGGKALVVGEYAYLDELFTELKGSLQNSYTIGFYVHPDKKVSDHEVELKLKREKCKVSHRKYLVY